MVSPYRSLGGKMISSRLFSACEVLVVVALAARFLLPANASISVRVQPDVHVELMPVRWLVPLVLVFIAGILSATTVAVTYAERSAAATKFTNSER